MPPMRPLSVMLWTLGWAALPCWPAGIASAVWWTGRAELALLSVAGAGTSSALALTVLRWAAAREAQHERLEGKLCDTLVASLPVPGRLAAETQPDLRVVR